MKIKNILYVGLALMSLTACNDYLDVDAPSSYTESFVYSSTDEMERALDGVYAQALSNNLYGNYYQRTFILNSDVDIQINSSNAASRNAYARFDCDSRGSEIYNFWTAAYNLIEYSNRFIYGCENSPMLNPNNAAYSEANKAAIMQKIGEAKCLRDMAYHDLVVMFGDVPFTFSRSAERKGGEFLPPVTDRQDIQDSLINDLKGIAPYMNSSASTTVERCSKEFAEGLIARIALTAGGYSLRPDKSNPNNYGTMKRPDNYKDYYKICEDYADSVIEAGTHHLTLPYQDVFVNECNYNLVNNDDVIFEIPFAKEASGNTGYIQGPTYSAYQGNTVGVWGATSGNGRLNAFYRFLFRKGDERREFVNGLWYYGYKSNADGTLSDSIYIRNDYSVHDNKWSKLWTSEGQALGSQSEGATGINYPYLRYADVLLMYAEAANELNDGPTEKAVECLREVHNRAFSNTADHDAAFLAQAQGSKEDFQKAVMHERMWEFAGENSRWRDLVRTNTYGEELVYSFLRYYSIGMQGASGPTGYEDAIMAHDSYCDNPNYINTIQGLLVYYHPYKIGEANKTALITNMRNQLYGYQVSGGTVLSKYPNQTLPSLRIYNAYSKATSAPTLGAIRRGGFSATGWASARFFNWNVEDTGLPTDQCKYSFYGYVRCDANGNLWINNNGVTEQLPSEIPSADKLPAVRYILPYPNLVIQRSAGAYTNYYGYSN